MPQRPRCRNAATFRLSKSYSEGEVAPAFPPSWCWLNRCNWTTCEHRWPNCSRRWRYFSARRAQINRLAEAGRPPRGRRRQPPGPGPGSASGSSSSSGLGAPQVGGQARAGGSGTGSSAGSGEGKDRGGEEGSEMDSTAPRGRR